MTKDLLRGAIAAMLAMTLVAGCDRAKGGGESADADHDHDHDHADHAAAPAPTNRVEIPASVRDNLGITFAKVERRAVAQSLRVPGRLELLPSARREYRTPVGGRVELLVEPMQAVRAGTPLYRVDSSGWRELIERIDAAQARLESMEPLRAAHREHEASLLERIAIWERRLKQLDELRAAGGGSASQFTEARATLNQAQTELSDQREKSAELASQQRQLESELSSLRTRRAVLLRASGCEQEAESFVVCALADGVVDALSVPQGGLVEENGHVLTTIQPTMLWFRGHAPQSDLGRVSPGMSARIVPPQGGSIPLQETMDGELQIGSTADPDQRTIDLIVRPKTLAPWARPGVSAFLEVTLKGGSEELAIPMAAVVRDGTTPVIFRRDPANPDRAIRMEADLGVQDGRWVVLSSGVREGEEVVVDGAYQLMLASSGSAPKGGHFHADGTFHEGKD